MNTQSEGTYTRDYFSNTPTRIHGMSQLKQTNNQCRRVVRNGNNMEKENKDERKREKEKRVELDYFTYF